MQIRRALTLPVVLAAIATALAVSAPPALDRLVETERAFASTCSQKGFREAFYTFYSDDVVTFAPAIEVGKESLKSPDPQLDRIILEWEPQVGDVAQAGDLGWLTGPYTTKDRKGERPVRFGQYLSIWKKQPSGEWRVVLDMGTPVPSEGHFGVAFERWGSEQGRVVDSAAAQSADVKRAEQRLNVALSSGGMQDAVCAQASPHIRLHRAFNTPVIGKTEVCQYLAEHDRKGTAEVVSSFTSSSGDLAYSYGRYHSAGATEPDAFFSRIWKRAPSGEWQIAVDTYLPARRQATTQ